MARKWETIRVFISSTFRDMHAERDHLIKVVFPELRERLDKYRFHLVDIDLRWGVTAEQADNDQVLDLCLEEIDRCRPFFVGILGQRYGWVPEELPDPAVRKFGWIQGMTGKSITELEILHGVLRNPSMKHHTLFYFRQPDYKDDVPQDVQEAVYTDQHGDKLDAIKNRIQDFCRQHDAPVREYPCEWHPKERNHENDTLGRIVGLEQFGEWVKEDLWDAIAREHPEILEEPAPSAPPGTDAWLEEEQDYHERFIESRLRVYVGREKIQEELTGYIESESPQPLLLVGGSGTGKSAILGKLWQDRHEKHPDEFILPHFVGASGASTNHHMMLRRFCLALRERFNLTEIVQEAGREPEERPREVPYDPQKLTGAFREFLAAVPGDQRVVLLIDAVNQLDKIGGAHEMNWLPRNLPPNVRIVVSCIEEPDQEQLALEALRRRKTPELRVEPLTDEERFEIVSEIPSISAKTLDPEQVGVLLDNPATRNPLFLIVALEELRGFGSFERLNTRIREFPSTEGEESVIALFSQVIERLEQDVNPDTVHAALACIATSRSGLSERELTELLQNRDAAKQNSRDPSGELQVMLRQIRPYLLRRGELVDFYHRNFYKAVSAHYLNTENARTDCHQTLAKYFKSKGLEFERMLSETPHHMAGGAMRDELEELLTDFPFLQAKVDALGPQPLIEDYDLLKVERNDPLGLVQGFLQLSAHIIAPEPAQLATQLHGHLVGTEARLIRRLLEDASSSEKCWLRPVAPCFTPPGGALLRTLTGHANGVLACAFSPDGRRIVSSSWDGTLKLWEAETGAELATLTGHTEWVGACAFSPDGRRIVSASRDKTLKLWEAETGAELATLTGHTNWVAACAFSPDGRRIVSGSWDNTLKLWEAETGAELAAFTGHTDRVGACAFSPDGRWIISGSNDKTLKLWEAETGAELATLTGHADEVWACAFSPDGRRIVSASWDETLKLWEAETGAELATLTGHTHGVWACAFSPDGRCIVSGSYDRTLKLWDAETGAELATLTGHTGAVEACAFSPDGRRIVAGTRSGFMWILEPEGIHTGPIPVTLWQPDPDRSHAFGCPICRTWSEVPNAALGTELPCPNCGETVILNPFVIEADWRPIAGGCTA